MRIDFMALLKNIVNFVGSLMKKLLKVIFFLKKAEAVSPEHIHSIVIICLHYLGDFMFATPAIKAIRKKYPKTHIAIWIKSRTAQIVKDCSFVDEIIVFDEVCTDRTKEKGSSWRKRLAFSRKLKLKNFDLLVDLSGVFDSILIGILSGIKNRYGFSSQGLGFLFQKDVKIRKGQHLVERYNAVAQTLGVKVENSRLSIELKKDNEIFARKFLNENLIGNENPLVCIHPGAGWKGKTWPIESFSELADNITIDNNVKIVICGGENDVAVAQAIIGRMSKKPIMAAGRFSLGQLAALINRCDVYVGHDSGPTYIAEALGRPLVVLFGPTNPLYSAPRTENSVVISRKLSCSPRANMQNCHNRASYPCRNRKCLRKISVEDVLTEIRKILNDSNQEG